MKLTLISIFLALAFYSCTSASGYLQKANAAIEKGNYRQAIELLDKALVKKKYLSYAYTDKAYCYSQLGNDDSAIIVYNQLITFYPNNTLALYNAGLCKYRQEKFYEAIDYFKNAMRSKNFNPDDTTRSQFILEYSPAGQELLGKENRFDVPFSEIFYMAGLAYFEVGKRQKSYTYFEECISRGYKTSESHYMIGMCWLLSNQKEKACESFRKSSIYGYMPAIDQLDKTCE